MNYIKLLILTTACLLSATIVKASEPRDYKLEINDFSELKVTDGINVEYHCSSDSAGMAYFNCTPEILPLLLFGNHKECLTIQLDNDGVQLTTLPTIHVYSSKLTKVENSSDSTIIVHNNVPVNSFKARLIGNGTLIIHNIEAASLDAGLNTGKGHIVLTSGKVFKAKLLNVGTGTVEAGGLAARAVTVKLFGTGDIDCNAIESLTVYGAGSGNVYYTGNPSKVTNRSLGVKAIDINEKTDN